jgi:hypothetical protein
LLPSKILILFVTKTQFLLIIFTHSRLSPDINIMAPSLPTITVPKSPRFAAYNALMVFSAVSLAAIASSDPGK